MPPAYSKDTLYSVLALLDKGKKHAEIIAKTGVSSSYITRVTKKHRPHLERLTRGRPRKLNPTATRHAVRLVTNGSAVNTRQATQILSNIAGEPISTNTVRRALKQAGLKPKKKVKKPKLTPDHIKARIQFAQAHKDWTIEDWKRVLWSDETKFKRLGSDGVHWVWVRPGEELSDRLTLPTMSFGGGGLMFWGCMGWMGTGYGTKLETPLNMVLYKDILEDEFLKSLEHLGMEPGEVIFQFDNAHAHVAKSSLKWLDDHGIQYLEWPANSPDLNPIENLWSEMKRRLGEYESPPGGILELWERVQVVYNDLGVDYCRKLIESMPRRMELVLKNRGKAIPY
ncbi:transposase, partial [Rhizoctonia solani AG-3 Rhs1AP]